MEWYVKCIEHFYYKIFTICFETQQIYDMVSDINLTIEIFFAINHEAAHERGKDREGITDTPKEWVLLLSGWASLICIIIPYLLNIFLAIKIPALTNKFACTRY